MNSQRSRLVDHVEMVAESLRRAVATSTPEELGFRMLSAFQVVAWSMLVYKAAPDLHRLWFVAESEFFPPIMRSLPLFAAMFIVPYVLTAAAVFSSSHAVWKLSAAAQLVCAVGLLLHQRAFPEASVLTSLWIGVYRTWFAWRVLPAPSGEHRANAVAFAQLLLCFVFLGGAVGKFTPGYHTTGEPFRAFGYPTSSVHILHNWFEADWLARIYGRLAVAGELALALSILLRPRVTFVLTVLVIVGMLHSGTVRFFDAIGPLLGLAMVGWLLGSRHDGDQRSNSD